MTEDLQGREFGKYRLLQRIGSGGMAEIWKASLAGVDGFEKILVVKKILPRYARHRQFITMFVQEAKVCSGLHHANVVQIYELGEEGGEYYIAMEYVAGCDLLKLLTRSTKQQRPIPPELCLFIVTEVCKGLGYAHTAADGHGKPLNIVHLDVSPSNILLSLDGEVKLTDFGVAKATVEGKAAAADDRLKGKLGYMSPEQVTGKPLDRRSDIFSIGIILYEIFTLKRLFLGKTDLETLSNIRDANVEARLARHPEVPEAVADIIRRALTRNQDTRYQTTHEMEEAISQYLFEQRIRVTPMLLGAYLRELLGHGEKEAEPETKEEMPAVVEHNEPPGDTRGPRLSDDTLGPRVHVEKVLSDSRPGHAADEVTPVNVPAQVPSSPASQFRFKSDHGEFGPITYNNLRNLLQAHSVSPDELVSVDGSEWRRVGEVSGLRSIVPPALTTEPEAPDDSGSFGLRNAVRLIARIASMKRTGRLKLIRRGQLKEIWFRRGKPVHISSTNKQELFGAQLVTRGVVSPGQLAKAFAHVKSAGGPLGTALVQIGAIDHTTLLAELDHQFHEKFIEIFAWRNAAYEYFPNQEPGPHVVPFRMEPFSAITEGVRRHVSADTLEAYLDPMLKRVVKLVSVAPFDLGLLKLAPREKRIRDHLSARPMTIEALIESLPPTFADVVRQVLYLLHETEHIRIG